MSKAFVFESGLYLVSLLIPQMVRAIIAPQKITINATITKAAPQPKECPQYIIGNHLLLFYFPFLLALFLSNQTFHSTTSLTPLNEPIINEALI
jgi:hypothetical protein